MLAVSLQPETFHPVTVYVCADVGVAVIVFPVVALNPVAGNHVYEVAVPLAVSFTESPEQKVVALPAVTLTEGTVFIDTETLAESEQLPLLPTTV